MRPPPPAVNHRSVAASFHVRLVHRCALWFVRLWTMDWTSFSWRRPWERALKVLRVLSVCWVLYLTCSDDGQWVNWIKFPVNVASIFTWMLTNICTGLICLLRMCKNIVVVTCWSRCLLNCKGRCGEVAVMLLGTTQIFAALLDILCTELFNWCFVIYVFYMPLWLSVKIPPHLLMRHYTTLFVFH